MKHTDSIRERLIQIFNLGDRDEMSWKHIGHGVASILAHDTWELCDDYVLPKQFMDENEIRLLDEYWSDIHFSIDEMGKQKFIDLIPEIKGADGRLMYLGEYLDASWLTYGKQLEDNQLQTGGK